MIPVHDNVYLDANFLVAYLVPNHVHHGGAGNIMVDLLTSNNTLYFSPLGLSETLHGIIIEKKKDPLFAGRSTSSFYTEVKNATDILLVFPQLKLKEFENNMNRGCLNAVDYMRDLNLKSHDAFHLAYARDLGINYIVTNDAAFNGITSLGITKIDF